MSKRKREPLTGEALRKLQEEMKELGELVELLKREKKNDDE